MIDKITLHNFRLFKNLELYPKGINVIYGKRGAGKTTVLEAIMYTTLLEHEFFTLLISRLSDQVKTGLLREYIETSFFSGDPDQDNCFSEVSFNNQVRKRQLQIWRTDEGLSRSIGGPSPKVSPFIFVYESVDSTKLFSRAVPYTKVEALFRDSIDRPRTWPLNYVPAYKVLPVKGLIERYRLLMGRVEFFTAMESMVAFYQELQSIQLVDKRNKERDLLLRFTYQASPVSISAAPKSIIKILQIITSLIMAKSDFFLIDDIDLGLTSQEVEWLVGVISKIALDRQMQLFVSASNRETNTYFFRALGTKHPRLNTWDLSAIVQPNSNKPVRL